MPCLLRPNGWQDVLVSHLAAKGFKSTVFGCFWHSWGTSKACNCYRFLRFDSASSGPKAIAHFALMHLRQQKIATYSVSATSVLAVHRLAMPCSHRINMEFQNSDQRCSLCTPCICDCCRMGVKITTCMDMHGSALVSPYILVGDFGHGSGPSASRALAGLGKCCSEVGMKSALQTARKISSRRLQK